VKNLGAVTIVNTRYGGAYEGGLWLAFKSYPAGIPFDIYSDDGACAAWFNGINDKNVGKGNTPTEAFNDLYHNKS